jgi:DNA transposition AAA+ family ATPase
MMPGRDWIEQLNIDARIGGPRALPEGASYTREAHGRIVLRLNDYLNKVGRTMEWAADSMGIRIQELRQAVSGTLAEPEAKVRAIDKWLESELLKQVAPRPAKFVRTGVAEMIFTAARFAVESACIVLVHGPAGVGKTHTSRAILSETPGAIYISIRTAGQTAMAVLDSIAAELRINEQSTRARMFSAIASALRDTGRLLIVDEIHKLEGRRKDEALHCLRDLHDATGIPMLWLGMSNIAAYIMAGQAKGYEPLDQLYSRIGLWLDLTEIAERGDSGPGLASIEDIRKFLAARQLRITRDGEEYLRMLANELGGGAFRTLDKLLFLAAKLARGGEIDARMLRSIQARRLGLHAAEAMEARMMAHAVKASA